MIPKVLIVPIRNDNKSCQQQMSSQRLFFPIIQLTFLKLPSPQHLLNLPLNHLLSLLLASWLLCCPLSFRIFVSPLNPLTYPSMISPSGGSDMPPKRKHKHNPVWNTSTMCTLLNLDVPVFKMYMCHEASMKNKNHSLKFVPGYKIYKDPVWVT